MTAGAVDCPRCGHGFSAVLTTNKRKRWRQCTKCTKKFATREIDTGDWEIFLGLKRRIDARKNDERTNGRRKRL